QAVEDARGDGDDVLHGAGEFDAQQVGMGVDTQPACGEGPLDVGGEGGVVAGGDHGGGEAAGEFGGDGGAAEGGEAPGAGVGVVGEGVGDDLGGAEEGFVLDALGDADCRGGGRHVGP